jgi:hypothetical protein
MTAVVGSRGPSTINIGRRHSVDVIAAATPVAQQHLPLVNSSGLHLSSSAISISNINGSNDGSHHAQRVGSGRGVAPGEVDAADERQSHPVQTQGFSRRPNPILGQ